MMLSIFTIAVKKTENTIFGVFCVNSFPFPLAVWGPRRI